MLRLEVVAMLLLHPASRPTSAESAASSSYWRSRGLDKQVRASDLPDAVKVMLTSTHGADADSLSSYPRWDEGPRPSKSVDKDKDKDKDTDTSKGAHHTHWRGAP